jgi:hypothetical protein
MPVSEGLGCFGRGDREVPLISRLFRVVLIERVRVEAFT